MSQTFPPSPPPPSFPFYSQITKSRAVFFKPALEFSSDGDVRKLKLHGILSAAVSNSSLGKNAL